MTPFVIAYCLQVIPPDVHSGFRKSLNLWNTWTVKAPSEFCSRLSELPLKFSGWPHRCLNQFRSLCSYYWPDPGETVVPWILLVLSCSSLSYRTYCKFHSLGPSLSKLSFLSTSLLRMGLECPFLVYLVSKILRTGSQVDTYLQKRLSVRYVSRLQ